MIDLWCAWIYVGGVFEVRRRGKGWLYSLTWPIGVGEVIVSILIDYGRRP